MIVKPEYKVIPELDRDYIKEWKDKLDAPYNKEIADISLGSTVQIHGETIGVAYIYGYNSMWVFAGLSHYKGIFSLRMALEAGNLALGMIPDGETVISSVLKENLSVLLTLHKLGFIIYEDRRSNKKSFLAIRKGFRYG